MIFPTLVVDNFFSDPHKVKDFSQKISYEKDIEGGWPGKRSEPLHQINFNLFNYFHLKILSILYPSEYEKITYRASCHFQKISKERHPHKGLVHKDNGLITGIVYLSKHKNCGTSLWKPKDFHNIDKSNTPKRQFYKKDNFDENMIPYIEEHNGKYEKILEIPSIFNRLILFDSCHPHSANNFLDENVEEDRLTLITFIDDLHIPNHTLKYPLIESKRLD